MLNWVEYEISFCGKKRERDSTHNRIVPSQHEKAGQRRADRDTTFPRRIAVSPMLAWHSLLAGNPITENKVTEPQYIEIRP